MVAPNRPSSLIRSTICAGQTSSRSSCMTCGATSRASQRSIASRSCRASGESGATDNGQPALITPQAMRAPALPVGWVL